MGKDGDREDGGGEEEIPGVGFCFGGKIDGRPAAGKEEESEKAGGSDKDATDGVEEKGETDCGGEEGEKSDCVFQTDEGGEMIVKEFLGKEPSEGSALHIKEAAGKKGRPGISEILDDHDFIEPESTVLEVERQSEKQTDEKGDQNGKAEEGVAVVGGERGMVMAGESDFPEEAESGQMGGKGLDLGNCDKGRGVRLTVHGWMEWKGIWEPQAGNPGGAGKTTK